MRRRARIEDGPHTERWLVSYADFMTLMFALFVVLFASAYHDKKAIQKVSAAVRNGFEEMGTFPDKIFIRDVRPSLKGSDSWQKISEDDGPAALKTASTDAGIDVAELHRKLNEALGKEIERQEIAMRATPEGFVISLRELGFFASGDARLAPGAADKVKRIAAVLTEYGLDMRVEGHSDNVPIHNSMFSSNWELSTQRAMAVTMMLIDESGVDPGRISIAGYGEYHPTASNDTPEGRKANRRVDIVVVFSSKHAPVRVPVG
jgi:chemotaxis protein MotB